jgi:nicotinamide-nucleotide amidase
MFDRQLIIEAKDTLDMLRDGGLMLATAESCTGGLVAGLLTSIAGSSAVVERGFVTYSNEAKAEMLGVPMALIEQHGAVSEQVAREMAEGALRHSRAQVAVSVTGIAGTRRRLEGKTRGSGSLRLRAHRNGHPSRSNGIWRPWPRRNPPGRRWHGTRHDPCAGFHRRRDVRLKA